MVSMVTIMLHPWGITLFLIVYMHTMQAYWMVWKVFKVCDHNLLNHIQVSDQDMWLLSNIKTKEKEVN